MKYVDLTHTFTSEMPVYPGDPLPTLKSIASITENGFTDHELTSGMHVGTHMDAPLHMLEGGLKLSEIPPEKFFGKGILIDARGRKEIGHDIIPSSIGSGTIPLILTGFSARYRTPEYFTTYPVMTKECADMLVQSAVPMVGFDFPSPDREPFPIHKILLGGGVLILENLTNLEELLGAIDFDVVAFPAKLDSDGAPARVIARINT